MAAATMVSLKTWPQSTIWRLADPAALADNTRQRAPLPASRRRLRAGRDVSQVPLATRAPGSPKRPTATVRASRLATGNPSALGMQQSIHGEKLLHEPP